MCISPKSSTFGAPASTYGAGVGLDTPERGSATETMLKAKNTELATLQSQLLSVPRSERKSLLERVNALDESIKLLQRDYASSNEIQHAAIALSEALDEKYVGNRENGWCTLHRANNPEAIAQCLDRLSAPMMAVLGEAVDEVALCYLIGASERVLLAIQRHPGHPGVIKSGFSSLCNLFAALKQLDNGEGMAQQLATAEVGQAVLAAMEAQPAQRDVCFWGCRLVNILAITLKSKSAADASETTDEKIARMCFSTGARVAVSKARRQHPTDIEVTQWADCAMRLL